MTGPLEDTGTVPAAFSDATIPPILSALRRHVYGWAAESIPYECAVDLEPAGVGGVRILADGGRVIAPVPSRPDARWGHLTSPGADTTWVFGTPEATGIDDGIADLVLWVPLAPRGDEGWRPVLVEARRITAPSGRAVLALDSAVADELEPQMEALGFPSVTRIDQFPLIGSALGREALSADYTGKVLKAAGALLILSGPDAARLAPEGSLALEDGARALRLEAGGSTPGANVDLDEVVDEAGASRAEIEEERARLDADRATFDTERAELLRQVARAEDERARADENLRSLEKTLSELESRVAAERSESARAEALAETVQAELDRTRMHKQLIESSISWRVTAPIRGLKRLFRR